MAIEHRQTYEDFVDDVSLTSGVSKPVVDMVIHATFDSIRRSVSLDEQVRIPKFGSFSPVERPERHIKSVRTGKIVTLPPCRGIKFLASKLLIAGIQDVTF